MPTVNSFTLTVDWPDVTVGGSTVLTLVLVDDVWVTVDGVVSAAGL